MSVPRKPSSTRSSVEYAMLAAWRMQRAVVLGARDELRADDQVGLAGLEDVDRAAVEVGVAEVDLVADDELAAREQDALLERLAVVRLADADDLHLTVGRRRRTCSASSWPISTVRSREPFSARMIS